MGNAGCEGWIDWNLCLDATGGPNHASNFCVAPAIVNLASNSILLQPCYWCLAHFARFIRPGARRLICSSTFDALEVTAFANSADFNEAGDAAGTVAVVVLNQTVQDIDFCFEVSKCGAMYACIKGHT